MVKVCVLGTSVIDCVLPGDWSWPTVAEARTIVPGLYHPLGGNGLNTAVALRDCGVKAEEVRLITATSEGGVGHGNGQRIMDRCTAKNIKFSRIASPINRAGVSVIKLSPAKDGIFVCYPGAASGVTSKGLTDLVDALSDDELRQWKVLHLTYGMFPALTPQHLIELVQRIRARRDGGNHLCVTLDVNRFSGERRTHFLKTEKASFLALLQQVDYFMPDEYEAVEYLSDAVHARPNIEVIQAAFLGIDLGPCVVVVKRAEEPVLYLLSNRWGSVGVAGKKVTADSIGAGDAWAGGFIATLVERGLCAQNAQAIAAADLDPVINAANLYAAGTLGKYGGPADPQTP